MKCFPDVDKSIENAERLARIAVDKGAKLILLPELFERNYFCQERRYDYYSFAKPVMEDEAVKHFLKFTEETGTVMPISFYEKDGNVLYNTVAMLDSGKYLGIYRKTHIPDDHYYQEKFYFTPGNTGFKVFSTSVGRVGVGICWDQWFPETARALTINGAEIILYPTAIGSEPILETDSSGHWRRTMQGHAAANIVPVVAANRIGTESVTPSKENGGQESSLTFYGSSFITDDTGEIIASAGKSEEEVLTAELDLAEADRDRLEWGLMRDRRPECYRVLADE
jgi:N-carbamoylputrescine amidase